MTVDERFWLIVDASFTPDEYAALVARCKVLVWAPFLRGDVSVPPVSERGRA